MAVAKTSHEDSDEFCLALHFNSYLVTVQSETSLTARLLIPPPMRHKHNLSSSKEQEDKQHAKVESRIERRGQNVVPPSPKSVAVAVRPEHHDEATNQAAEVAGADVAVEVRHGAEEDGRVEEVEFGSWEEAVQGVNEDWSDCA